MVKGDRILAFRLPDLMSDEMLRSIKMAFGIPADDDGLTPGDSPN